MTRRIAITGPESSGKTTLARAVAAHYGAPWVPEFAREYLERIDRPYVEADLIAIAKGQLAAEEARADASDPLLVCDTDMITLRIWSQEKYGRVAPELEQLMQGTHYDLALLCRPDIPWEYDPLRENPHDRDRLFEVYHETLIELQRPFVIIEGDRRDRLHRAVHAIGEVLG
ncbi:MAG: ATP-binding protein [Flavobacteriales bacterium]|nr:ATP-binding protein [Flavobacteriales bacterium]